MFGMGWFSQGKDVSPSAEEAKMLWDDEAPQAGPGAAVMSMRDAFQIPGHGTVFSGWVESGAFRPGQSVIVQGRAGFGRGTVGKIAVGRGEVQVAKDGDYATFSIPNLSVRVEVLDLDEGCTIIGV